MDLEPINSDDDDSPPMPQAPSPPKLSPGDTYKSYRRSPSPDRRRRKRSKSRSRSRSPGRSKYYRRSRSKERESERTRDRDRDRERDSDRDREREKDRERDRIRDRDRERDRERDRDRNKDRERERDRDKNKSKKSSKKNERSRSRSKSKSKSRSRSKSVEQKPVKKTKHSNAGNSGKSLLGPYPQPVQQTYFPVQSNAFKNDGSFMEMFKKMQQQIPKPEPQPTIPILEEKPVAPPPLIVGKRRGGRILKTGIVAKPKTEVQEEKPKDAWALYMQEVKKYREVCCQEEDNTRPLVK